MNRTSRIPMALLALVLLVFAGPAQATQRQDKGRVSAARAQDQQQSQQHARQQAQRVSRARQQQVTQRAARARAQQQQARQRVQTARRQQEAKRVQAARAHKVRAQRMRAQKARTKAIEASSATRIQGARDQGTGTEVTQRVWGARTQKLAADKAQRVGSARHQSSKKMGQRITGARLSNRVNAAEEALGRKGMADSPLGQKFLEAQAQHLALLQRLDNFAAQMRANGQAELLPRLALVRQSAIASFELVKAELRQALQTAR